MRRKTIIILSIAYIIYEFIFLNGVIYLMFFASHDRFEDIVETAFPFFIVHMISSFIVLVWTIYDVCGRQFKNPQAARTGWILFLLMAAPIAFMAYFFAIMLPNKFARPGAITTAHS